MELVVPLERFSDFEVASGIGRPDGVVYRPSRKAITDGPAKPIGKKLQRAIEARRHYGFDTDPDVVRAIMRDPWQPASRKFGFPMTAAEESSIWSMSAKASQAGHVQPRHARKREGA